MKKLFNCDGVVKSPIYCTLVSGQTFDVPYVLLQAWSNTKSCTPRALASQRIWSIFLSHLKTFYESINCNLILLIILLTFNVAIAFDGEWESRAMIEVSKTGINEAVLPPALLMNTSSGKYDISLTGPDGNLRPLELYMRDKKGRKEIDLQPLKIELTKNGGFIWECNVPDELLTEIQVNIQERNYVGKVHVEGFDGKAWQFIARNQAVYKVYGVARAVIDILDANYKKIRLHFVSFDKRYKQKIVPIKNVTGIIKKAGKEYAVKEIDLTKRLRRTENSDFTELKTLLQGKGLNIKSVLFETGIQFQGFWEIGYETINYGKSQFVLLKSGNISYVDKDKQVVSIRIDKIWPSKTMILRLKPDIDYIGVVNNFSIEVRLPRIVFSADMTGTYTVFTGTENLKKLLSNPGDSKRIAEHVVVFTKPEFNPSYNTKSLVEKYKIKGGPFNETGYLWSSPFMVSEPGYYKLNFNLKAALDSEYKKIRLVKDGLQVPFFFGRYENKTIGLDNKSAYDAKNNKTSWLITIPEVSSQWQYLTLTSSGIFKRNVFFYKKRPGNTGWKRIYSKSWQNKSDHDAKLRVQIASLFRNQKKIKIEINHGDNQPINVRSIEGVYRAPTINFLAHQNGQYFLYGGNGQALQADYDLSLVQQKLLETLPVEIEMAEIEASQAEGWPTVFIKQFQEQGWGLYLILGIVTIFLLAIIIRLFPSVATTEAIDNQQSIKEIDHKEGL